MERQLGIVVHAVFGAKLRAQALSPVGRCQTFEAAADGYGRGEACVVVLLQSLTAESHAGEMQAIIQVRSPRAVPSQGIRAKHLFYHRRYSNTLLSGKLSFSVFEKQSCLWSWCEDSGVQGSATNQDGRSSSLTAPNGPAQQALILSAVELSRGVVDAIGLIATHGTGTPLGDPIETGAIGAAVGARRKSLRTHLGLSSVKSCYGHTEGAAGAVTVSWFSSRLNELLQRKKKTSSENSRTILNELLICHLR